MAFLILSENGIFIVLIVKHLNVVIILNLGWISPAHPQKENRLILKGWGVKLRVLGWIFWGYINQSGTVFGTN